MELESIDPCPADECSWARYACPFEIAVEHTEFYRGDRDDHAIEGCPACHGALSDVHRAWRDAPEPPPVLGDPGTLPEPLSDAQEAVLGPDQDGGPHPVPQ